MVYQESFTDSTGKTKQLSFRFHRESRQRYKVPSVEVLEEDDYALLKKLIKHFRSYQRPRIQELLDYAEGNNHGVSVEQRRQEQDMSDNRAVHNFGRLISVFKQGYLVGNPIRIEYDDGENESKNDERLKEIARLNSFYDLHRALVLDLSRTGRAFDLVYRSESDETRVRKLDPREVFVIYDQTIEEAVIAVVRVYGKDLFNKNKLAVELYTEDKIVYFDFEKDLKKLNDTPHSFGMVPITEYLNSSNGMGDYESALYLFDLYDASQSDTANYMTDLADAILAIYGRINFPESCDTAEKQIAFLRTMRKARFMNFEPPTDTNGNEGSVSAEYLYKQYDVEFSQMLQQVYSEQAAEMQRMLYDFVSRYAEGNNLSYQEALQKLRGEDLSDYRRNAQRYRESAEKDPELLKRLNEQYTGARVSRMDALNLEMSFKLGVLQGVLEDNFEKYLKRIAERSYKQIMSGRSGHINAPALREMVRTPFNGSNYSQQLWGNTDDLAQKLRKTLTTGFIRGDHPRVMAAEIRKQFNVSRARAETLIRTDRTMIVNRATQQRYLDAGLEYYRVLVHMDQRTSEICRRIHAEDKRYKLDEMKIGDNAPPFHYNCRSTIIPDDEELNKAPEVLEKDENKEYNVVERLAGAIRGKLMSFEEANAGRANPNYGKYRGYSINCQSCVVTYEARRRGYDVETLPNTKGSMLERLYRSTNLAWRDPKTGKNPEYITDPYQIYTPAKFKKFLHEVVEEGNRYTLEFAWKGRSNSGHIIHVDKVDGGELRLYDPQTGGIFMSKDLNAYLKNIKYSWSSYGRKRPLTPKILRVDNLEFDKEVVEKIMKETEK